MNNKKLTFENKKGQMLSARVELPANQLPKSYALFAHCFTCSKDLGAVRNISRALTQNGFGVVRFDFTGLGESEGDFQNTDFSSNIDDLEAAASYMEEHLEGPKLLVGHSLGGAAVLFAAKRLKHVQAVASIGAPSSPQHVQHLFQNSLEEINEAGKAKVKIGGRQFTIQRQFIEDISEKNTKATLKTLKKALLILHSPQDSVVDISNAADLYSTAMHPKSFISLDGADHLLSKKEDSVYVGNVISGWASRYIKTNEREKLKTNNQVAVRVGNDSYTTDITTGHHQLTADEPTDVGGNDFGPSPYALLLASLGACTAMTLRMYADRKGWKLEEVIVHLDHKKDYLIDCGHCEQNDAKIDQINRSIELSGKLESDQRDRLLEIADKCPVHKTLHGEVHVTTELLN